MPMWQPPLIKMAKHAQPEKHEHAFGSYNQCACGSYRISRTEYAHRARMWSQHYDDCVKTESGQSFWLCHEAYKAGDMGAVKDFAAQAKQRRESRNYLSKPAFPDPTSTAHSWSENGEWAIYTL